MGDSVAESIHLFWMTLARTEHSLEGMGRGPSHLQGTGSPW